MLTVKSLQWVARPASKSTGHSQSARPGRRGGRCVGAKRI
ncbi:hypothetical protein I547_4070 [Mycobacterium kansasii 824]|nr:hypothetical protein I547_4070 [Mycobacterium kansasii 824]